MYAHNPFMNPAQQQRNEPVLLHPQPLPPQVQQSILTRGILPTPGLPDTAGQGGQYMQQAGPPSQQSGQHHQQQGAPNAFTGHANNAYAHQQQTAKPTQLTGHAMTLLNAFKSGPRDGGENKPPGSAPQGNAFSQANNQQQYQSSPRTNFPTTQASNPAAQYLPQHMTQGAPMRISPRTMQPPEAQPGPKHAQPADSHRTALLDIFKRSGPRSPLSNEIRMQPGSSQESPSFAGKNEPSSPAYKAPSAAEAIASASEANGEPVRMNPEVTLPYRAVQILSRPKQAEPAKPNDYSSTQAQMQRLQQRLSPQESRTAGRQGQPSSPRERSFLQQQMEQEAKRSPQLHYAAAQAASLPYAKQSPSSMHSVPSFHQQHQQQQQPTSVLPRRKDSNPEQRQKLLSLFGTSKEQQQQPSAGATEEKGKGKEHAAMYDRHPHQQQMPSGTTPRSRVASFASAGGNEPTATAAATFSGSAATSAGTGAGAESRRGSQTPISPADRNFLLSYLESVTNVGR
jgi:mRNA-decapping enzyme subunit 2